MPFETTRWSRILRAQSAGTVLRAAKEELCERYWPPLYAFLRAKGYSQEESYEALQSFFVSFLEEDFLKNVDSAKGRFRTFMLTALIRSNARERKKEGAIKRGGDIKIVSLDALEAEGTYNRIPANTHSPEALFDRQWALKTLEHALRELEIEYLDAGKGEFWNALKPALALEDELTDYAGLSELLNMTSGALRVAVHRLRARYRQEVFSVIRETVESDEEANEEFQYLLRALSPNST